jgi:hypothetical protein
MYLRIALLLNLLVCTLILVGMFFTFEDMQVITDGPMYERLDVFVLFSITCIAAIGAAMSALVLIRR